MIAAVFCRTGSFPGVAPVQELFFEQGGLIVLSQSAKHCPVRATLAFSTCEADTVYRWCIIIKTNEDAWNTLLQCQLISEALLRPESKRENMTISFRLSDLFKALCTKGKNTMCMQTSCDWHSQYLYITMHLSCSMCFHTWVWVGYTLLGPVGWCHSLYSQRCHSTSASPAGKPPSSAPKSLPSRAKCTSHCQSQKPEPAENRTWCFLQSIYITTRGSQK